MEELLRLLKEYNKERHIEILERKISNNNYDWTLIPIYDEEWEKKDVEDLPYESITQILDSYYCLPERIDLAFLFCWQSINNSYNQLQIKDTSVKYLSDKKGIDLLIQNIDDLYSKKYELYLKEYIDKAPTKIFKFISNYILKGYVIEKARYESKYYSSSYNSFKKRFKGLYNDICNSYGESYNQLCKPYIKGTKVRLNIMDKDKDKSRKIVHSLANKLEELFKTKKVIFSNSNGSNSYRHQFTNKDVIEFLLVCILYANRCNNFHGNVASRLNSIYSNKDSYLSNRYIFLLAHIICAISLNINGYLSDGAMKKLETNSGILE